MNTLLVFSSRIDDLSAWFGRKVSWLILVLVLVTVEQVAARYLFSNSSIAMQELQWHLFAVLFLIALADTMRRDGHVRVDIFYGQCSIKRRALIDILGTLFLLLPCILLLIYYGSLFASRALELNNHRPMDYFSAYYFTKDGWAYSIFSLIESLFRHTILQGEVSNNPGGLEARWLIKAMIPFSFLLLLLQSLSQLIKNAQRFLHPDQEVQ